MHHNSKQAVVTGILSAITPLVFQVISGHIFQSTQSVSMNVLLATTLGIVSYVITSFISSLLKWKRALRGLYFVIYTDAQDPLCSVINIEYKEDFYLIDVYDFKLQQDNSRWVSVQSTPRGHSDIYFNRNSREFHIISRDEIAKSCIFFNFFNAQEAAAVTRYGCNAPFNRYLTGRLFKLSRTDLCSVYNSSFDNHQFCNQHIKTINICRQGRLICRQSKAKVFQWVRQNNSYIEIPRKLYTTFEAKLDPVEPPPAPPGISAPPIPPVAKPECAKDGSKVHD